MFPDSDFFLKRLDVFKFMHTHDSKVRYIISITLTKWLHSSPGWDSVRGGLCSHQGGHALKLLPPRHHGSGRQLHQYPYKTASWLPLLHSSSQGGCKEDWRQCDEGEGLHYWRPWRHQQPALPYQATTSGGPPHKIVLQCLIISWEKLIIDKIIQPKSNESMWYFRPLELLEGFFSSVFKLVVLEFISWKASLLNDEHVCRETTSSWARVVALLAAERLFSQMG